MKRKKEVVGIVVAVLMSIVLLAAAILLNDDNRVLFGIHGDTVTVEADLVIDKLVLVSNNVTTVVAHPMEKYGAARDFPNGSVIVGGRLVNDNKGILARYTRTAQGTMVLADTYTFVGGDVIGLAYYGTAGGETLYMLDLGSREIRSAPYVVGNSIPTTWNTLATSTTLPELGSQNLHEYSLSYVADVDRLRIGQHQQPSAEEFVWIDRTTGAGTSFEGYDSWPAIDAENSNGLAVNATSVPFTAKVPGANVEIVRMLDANNWEVIGVAPANAGMANVQPLAYGDILFAKRADLSLPTPPSVTPVERTGTPDPLDAASNLRALSHVIGLGCYVGNDLFSVGLWADHVEPNMVSFPASYSAVCAVGTPADIVVVNGVPMLDTVYLVPFTLNVWSNKLSGFGEAEIPIGPAPEEEGLVFSFQCWVQTSSGVSVTDIISVIVRDEPFLGLEHGQLLGPLPPPAQASSSSSSAKVKRRRWAGLDKGQYFRAFLKKARILRRTDAERFRYSVRRRLQSR